MLIFLLERSLFDGIDLLEIDHLSISGDLFSTEGALRRPLTYDNHHIHPIPSIHLLPSRLNELNKPKIDPVDDRVDLQ